MLFVLALELLLAAIRKNADIRGVRIGDGEYKVAAYADDVLVYMSNPKITIPNVLKVVGRYGKLTNFKINMSKSEILKITTPKEEQQAIQPKFHFVWRKEELAYLGIKLTASLATSYTAILNKVKEQLNYLRHKPLSWLG